MLLKLVVSLVPTFIGHVPALVCLCSFDAIYANMHAFTGQVSCLSLLSIPFLFTLVLYCYVCCAPDAGRGKVLSDSQL